MICISCGAPTDYYTIFNKLKGLSVPDKMAKFNIKLMCCKTVHLNINVKTMTQ